MSEIVLVEKEEDYFDAFDAYFALDSEPIQELPTNENGEVIKSLHQIAFGISFLDMFYHIIYYLFPDNHTKSEIELVEKEEDNFDSFDAYFALDSGSILDFVFIILFIIFLSAILFFFLFFKAYYSLMSSIAAIFSIITYCLARNDSIEVTEASIRVFHFIFYVSLYFIFTFSSD